MRIGIGLPEVGPLGTRENIIRFAREAERAGYDSLWVLERCCIRSSPNSSRARSRFGPRWLRACSTRSTPWPSSPPRPRRSGSARAC